MGIFSQVKNHGIENIRPAPLTLSSNFRSASAIVNWNNRVFQKAFPNQFDVNTGSVDYTPSTAINLDSEARVSLYPLLNATRSNEAKHLIKIIRECQHHYPQGQIAILARSRTHLSEIISTLHAEKIFFNAVDIDKLDHRPEVRDLLSLTSALSDINDRIAWLSILRAPWCGLTLHDLHAITANDENKPIIESIKNFQNMSFLNTDAKKRLSRIVPILLHALQNKGKLSIPDWIEGTWLALGGPACLHDEIEIDNARAYFRLLETIDNGFNIELLKKKLDALYAQPIQDSHHPSIQIMTIHKAKGLEFDHVIIPSLDRKHRPDDKRLLLWLDRLTKYGKEDLILAPIKATDQKSDPIYDYLRIIENEKQHNELVRLFYVATTRAKTSLHLLMNLTVEENKPEPKIPSKNSLMHILWTSCKDEIIEKIIPVRETAYTPPYCPLSTLTRLNNDWQSPIVEYQTPLIFEKKSPTPIRLSLSSRHQLGTVIHEMLEYMAKDGIENWNAERIKKIKPFWERRLRQLGITSSFLIECVELTEKAALIALSDPKGRWILSNQHHHTHSEYRLTTLLNNQITHLTVDRTFIDNQGIRWIIDYKTATPHQQTMDEFLSEQHQQHATQLNQYAKALQPFGHHSIKLGLYFPLQPAWIEWNFEPCVVSS